MSIRFPDCRICLLLVLTGIALAVPGSTLAQTSSADSTDLFTREAQRFFVRGLTQAHLGTSDEALSNFQNALDLASHRPSILMAVAEAHASRGEYTSALFYAREARLAADRPRYTRALGDLLLKAGRKKEARTTYRAVLESHPNHVGTLSALAQFHERHRRPRRALRRYETLIDIRPEAETAIYSTMLRLYRHTGDSSGVANVLETLTRRRPNAENYTRQRAGVYTYQKRYDEAIRLYESLYVSSPGDTTIRNQLARLYRRTDQPDSTWIAPLQNP